VEESDTFEAELHDRQKVDYDTLLASAIENATPGARTLSEASLRHRLTGSWSQAYRRLGGSPEILEVEEGGFSYLFDLSGERAIAAFGSVQKPSRTARDRSRLAGFPRSLDRDYQKGHLIAHRLGGGLDINIVHQLGTANIGPFRRLEAEASRNPGSFYFVRLLYSSLPLRRGEQPPGGPPANPQRPRWIEQGLILSDPPFRLILREFGN
jgi:hypothetical protein